MAEKSLKDKTIKGVSWSALENISQYTMSFLIGVVLARLLTPDDYGLIGIITIFTSVSSTIINAGFQNALIRKKIPTEPDYSTVFVLNISISIVLYLVLFISAPYIAVYFRRPELINLTRVVSLTIIIGAVSIVQRVKLTKEIDFRSQTKVTLWAMITSGIIGISLAFLGFGVWALVTQYLLGNLLTTTLLFYYGRWCPKASFSIKSFKELFGYSWKILAGSILNTVWMELYQVVIGKYYKPSSLGQYTRANQFAQMLSSNITNVVQKVTFPVISEIQDERNRLLPAYRKIIKITMFITVLGMFALGAVSEPMIYVLIGPKWHQASTFLPILCLSYSLYPLHAINLNLLQVQGRSDIFLVLEVVKKIIGLLPLAIGVFVGIYEMLMASVFTSILGFFLNSYYSGKSIGYSSWMQLKDIIPIYIIAIIMGVPVYFLKYLPLSEYIVLPLQMVVGCTIVWLICEKTKNEEYIELKLLILKMINRYN